MAEEWIDVPDDEWVDVDAPAKTPEKPKMGKPSRLANIAKQAFDRGIAGTLGMPGDLANLLRDWSGEKERSIFPTSKKVYDTFLSPPKSVQTLPETSGEKVLDFAAGLAPDILTSYLMPAKPSPKIQNLADWLYGTGIKISTTATPIKRKKMIRTLMKERIPYSDKGFQKLIDLKASINSQIDTMVASGSRIPNRTVSDMLDAVESLKSNYSAVRQRDQMYAALDKIKAQILDVHGGGNINKQLSPQNLQRIKQDLYKVNRRAYEIDPVMATAEQVADKETARVAKEGIEQAIPGIDKVNKRYGDLKDAEDSLIRGAGRTANLEPLNVFDMGAGILETAATGSLPAGIATSAAIRAGRMPAIRSNAAFMLDAISQNKIPDYLRNLTLLELAKSMGITAKDIRTELERRRLEE